MKKVYAIAILTSLIAFSATALAAPDQAQRQMTQRIQEQKMKLGAIENAKGAERGQLMKEHIKMMQETLEKMHTMQPHAGVSVKEWEDWIAEHQRLLDQILEQVTDEQHLLMKEFKYTRYQPMFFYRLGLWHPASGGFDWPRGG